MGIDSIDGVWVVDVPRTYTLNSLDEFQAERLERESWMLENCPSWSRAMYVNANFNDFRHVVLSWEAEFAEERDAILFFLRFGGE